MKTQSRRRVIREKAVRKDKLGGISKSTFNRRYRFHPDAPEPLDLPDGMLGWWEDEWDTFLANLGRAEDPRENVAELPPHWLRAPRNKKPGNPQDYETEFPPQVP